MNKSRVVFPVAFLEMQAFLLGVVGKPASVAAVVEFVVELVPVVAWALVGVVPADSLAAFAD